MTLLVHGRALLDAPVWRIRESGKTQTGHRVSHFCPMFSSEFVSVQKNHAKDADLQLLRRLWLQAPCLTLGQGRNGEKVHNIGPSSSSSLIPDYGHRS